MIDVLLRDRKGKNHPETGSGEGHGKSSVKTEAETEERQP